MPTDPGLEMRDPVSARQIDALRANCRQAPVSRCTVSAMIRQGIVHVVGPEQGACLPGMSIVCGDSHTSTNGALGALAFGIGTSEVGVCAGHPVSADAQGAQHAGRGHRQLR